MIKGEHMRLSFSNIAWSNEQDEGMYKLLQQEGFEGLEIAPTRIFPQKPYDHNYEAYLFAKLLWDRYNLRISSMQSIWYGREEKIFGTDEERRTLIDYTKEAIDFAVSMDCHNLVFGCPQNRKIPEGADALSAYPFFVEIADYAQKQGTVIALEANPTIYGTNFINQTNEAFDYANRVSGLMVNVDLGTIIENSEDLQVIKENIHLVNHIHISEPYLASIQTRKLHNDLAAILKEKNYSRYVSVEMKKPDNIATIMQTAQYIREVFS
jgi:sugar phosphate isomerase/epimerase